MAQIDLTAEITRALRQYTTQVEEGLGEAQKTVANDGVKKLRTASPKKTGKYSKGWRMKKTSTGYVLHNKTHYQLTHLLEKGHAKVGGGRVAARTHIAEVEDEVIREYLNEVERLLSQ